MGVAASVVGGGVVVVVVVLGSGGGVGTGGAGVYFTGDSLERKSRRLGSRSRRGSLFEDGGGSGLPQNQPIVGLDNRTKHQREEGGVECQDAKMPRRIPKITARTQIH